MELARADPASTTEGQELLDEPGVMDFSRNGYRYLTSSPFVANTFRNFLGPSWCGQLRGNSMTAARAELEDAGSEKGGRSDVVIPTAVRQAVRRLHEKHRAHWPERW